MRHILAAVLVLFALPVLGAQPPAGSGAPFSNSSGYSLNGIPTSVGTAINSAFAPAVRAPIETDDANKGYGAGQFWTSPVNKLWTNLVNTAGSASWAPTSISSAYVCDAIGGCYTAYGVVKLVSVYAGNCGTITRNSDSATQALGYVNNVCDFATGDAFVAAGGTPFTAYWSTINNQTAGGSGHDCVPATANQSPPYTQITVNGMRTMSWDGVYRSITGAEGFVGASCVDAALSLNSQSFSYWDVGRINNWFTRGEVLQTGGSAASTFEFFTPIGGLAGSFNGISNHPGDGLMSSSAQLFGINSAAAGYTFYFDDKSFAGAVPPSLTLSGASYGDNLHAPTGQQWLTEDKFAFFTTSATLTSAQISTVLKPAIYSQFPVVPQLRQRMVFIGDSITADGAALYNQQLPVQIGQLLPKAMQVQNLGIPSATCAQINSGTNITGIKTAVAVSYDTYIHVWCGTNDIAHGNSVTGSVSGTTLTVTANIGAISILPGSVLTASNVTVGSTIASQLTGSAGCLSGTCTFSLSASSSTSSETITAGLNSAQTYANLQALVASIRSANPTSPILVYTALPRAVGNPFETVRQAFNASIAAGVANGTIGTGPNYLVDVGSDPTIGCAGCQNNLTYYFSDAVHPLTAGLGVAARVAYPVMMGVLK